MKVRQGLEKILNRRKTLSTDGPMKYAKILDNDGIREKALSERNPSVNSYYSNLLLLIHLLNYP